MAKKDETSPEEAVTANTPGESTEPARVKVTKGDKTLLTRPHLVPFYTARGYTAK